MTSLVTRRSFLAGSLAGLAAPLAAEAQRADRIPRIGLIALHSPEQIRHITQAVEQGLRDHGWIPGQNVILEYRFAHGRSEQLPHIAAELIRLNVDVLVTGPGPQALAAQEATKNIPIVFGAVTDPVGQGFVSSHAKPGGNMTGLATQGVELLPKRLELLKQAVPTITTVDVMMYPGDRVHEALVGQVTAAGNRLNLKINIVEARDPTEVKTGIVRVGGHGAAGLLIAEHSLFFNQRVLITENVAKIRHPAMYPDKEFVKLGGLMSYATDLVALFRRTGSFVDRLLKGAKPADLPVEQPTKFELVINLKTAKALGLTIPPSLLARADQVIE